MKALGYIRVSTKMQSEKGSSLEVQELKINDYCKLMDYDLQEVFEDRGISGMSVDKRDGYKELVSYMKTNEVDIVVVHSLSRLGRRMRDVIEFMEMLKKNGIKFYSIKESLSNDDKVGGLIVNILSSINEFEVETIRERIKDVKQSKKSRGLVYGRLQYGFKRVGDRLVRDECEMQVVKRVKNLRTRGYSWRKIAVRLNEEKVLSKEGKQWYDGSLYNTMKCYM
jgi:site-specific DNA recombinase